MDQTTIGALQDFPRQLEAHYAAIPPEFKHWAPASWDGVPSEPFTAIEQICHVRDIEIEGYQVRLRRTLTEAKPFLASIDSESLTRNYAVTGLPMLLPYSQYSVRRARARSPSSQGLRRGNSIGLQSSRVTVWLRCAASCTISAATISSTSRDCSGCSARRSPRRRRTRAEHRRSPLAGC